jgi:hypothetical protein
MITGPIDCDVHPGVASMEAILPYLDPMWRDMAERRGLDELISISYPSNSPLTVRADWRGKNNRAACTPAELAAQCLEPFGSSIAILNCLYSIQLFFSEDLARGFARAVNDWIRAEWLEKDARLRASILLPTQNVDYAVEEIERLAPDRRFVSVMFLISEETPPGRRAHWPIYAAAARHGLPVSLHAGSSYRNPPSPVGWTSFYTEDYVNQATAFQTGLTSLITEGVFAKLPELKVVMLESGFTWLPGYLWRLTKFWRGTRQELPWVTEPPAHYVREHVRFSLQPFDGPAEPADVERLFTLIDSDELLLFSTDYPHWQFEGTAALPAGLSPALVRRITLDNPLATYARLRETVA